MRKFCVLIGVVFILTIALGSQQKGKKKVSPVVQAKPATVARMLPPLSQIFFSYIGGYPHDVQTDWSGSLQGVAHDDNNWYFTQALEDAGGRNKRGYLIKFPLNYGLTRGVPDGATGYDLEVAGIRCVKSTEIPGNPLGNFWHFGDLVHYDGFLFVPVECSDNSVAQMIAVFRASDLAYIGSQRLLPKNTRAGWCAVHPVDKCLYVPRGDGITTEYGIYKYKLDMNKVKRASETHITTDNFLGPFGEVEHILIQDECGRNINLGKYNQGGEFSDDGRLLFLMTGKPYAHVGGERAEGITVYDTATWKRVTFSRNGARLFDYEFHPVDRAEEPEGLTWWDLDKHPRRREIPGNIGGQLHALMIDSFGNEFFFKHYRVDGMSDFREDLAPFAAEGAAVVAAGSGRWKVQQGPVELGGFRSEAEAAVALRILRNYRVDSIGYLAGRSYPTLRYVLSGGRAPRGMEPGTSELSFDPLGLRLKRDVRSWVITDESPHGRTGRDHENVLFFPDRERDDGNGVVEKEARTVIKIIRKYGFTTRCDIGGGTNPPFVYFRR